MCARERYWALEISYIALEMCAHTFVAAGIVCVLYDNIKYALCVHMHAIGHVCYHVCVQCIICVFLRW